MPYLPSAVLTAVPYMVGLHPNSPANPHSSLASGGTDANKIRTDPANEAYVLYGAVVGGPLKNDKFWDWRDDWAQTEAALDYNANVPALAAYQVSGDRMRRLGMNHVLQLTRSLPPTPRTHTTSKSRRARTRSRPASPATPRSHASGRACRAVRSSAPSLASSSAWR